MIPFFPFPHRPNSFSSYYPSEGDEEVDEKLVTSEAEFEKESDMWMSLVKSEQPETPPSIMEEAKGIEIDVFHRMKKAQSRGIRVGMKDGILRAIGPGRETGYEGP